MENRWNKRQLIRLNVMIYYGPLGLISGISRDLSSTGMFVETGRIVLASDEIIDLSFHYSDGIEDKYYSIPANVVHSSSKGAGLQFLNYVFVPANQPTANENYKINSFADA